MKTQSLTIRLSNEQALKISALSMASGLTKTEAILALLDSSQTVQKTPPAEATATPQNLAEFEGALSELQSSFSSLVDAVSTRLETIETTLADKLSALSEMRRQQSQMIELLTTQNLTPAQPVAVPPARGVFDDVPAQPVSGYPAQPVQSSPQAVDRLAFEDFFKSHPLPNLALPGSKLWLSHRQYIAKKYQDKYGVWPQSVPEPE